MPTKEELIKREEKRISKINNGIVIDRIPPGCALKVLEILGILPGTSAKVSFVMNIPSLKLEGGRKDIVKIEGRELTKSETDKITIIAPDATINIVRNYKVVEKYQVSLPDEIVDIIKCPRPTCITNDPKERGIKTKFEVIQINPIVIGCHHCETQINGTDISQYIKC